ncbi:Ferroporti-1 [Roridomyces roridus]|uniref:Solute carrier family 40 member n=1 Tax=Roridomyces roridus TaxID=1738132 RepID=A0AAD7BZT9_9AGAR|nr:Ferroporti-1 [Roridomyces roridus]
MEREATPGETTPLIHPEENVQGNEDNIDLRDAWGDRTAEFALYLYLIGYYKDTLLPSSIFGFSMTFTGILFSRWAGSLVDKMPKLSIVRWSIFVQKISALAAYACVLGLRSVDADARFSPPGLLLFLLLVFSGCVVHLSNTCISIAVERDWTLCISGGSSARLAKLNTWMRQINLLCKLVAPLFVSFLTVTFDANDSTPSLSVVVLATVSALTMMFELYWIQIVYDRFPVLAVEQQLKNERRMSAAASPSSSTSPSSGTNVFRDWLEFTRLPVFLSSLSISLLYLTVLSFDGTMLGYLKTLDFRDDFLAEMRGLCVVTGLLGTLITVPLENKIGSARAGSWSIWSMVVCLLPVMASFYIFGPRTTLGALLLFGGMAMSRIGLWSFDLIQTKQLQEALTTHARRNTITALQYTMQSVADLMKYMMTMILSRPSEFRWAGLISFLSVTSGAVVYAAYLKKERGHIFHSPAELMRKLI